MKNKPRVCKFCGCMDEFACLGGCYWVTDDLCSKCEDDEAQEQRRLHELNDAFPRDLTARDGYSVDRV